MKPSDQLEYQRETRRGLVAGVKPEQLSLPTPCTDWDVRGLISHFVGGAGMFAAAFKGEELAIDPDAPMRARATPIERIAAFTGRRV